MNVLVLNWRDMKHPEAGGAEVHFQQIFSRFVANGHSVFLLTTRFPGSRSQDIQDGIIVYRWAHTYTFNWEVPFLVRRVMKMHAIDCIVDDVNKIPFFSPRWFPHIPCGVIFHHLFGATIFSLAAYPLALYVLLLEKLGAIGYGHTPCCTVSQSTAHELVGLGFHKERIRIIENSVDTERYSPDKKIAKDPSLIVYAGRLKKYKNVSLLIDAVKKVNESGRVLSLAIAGTGDDENNLKAQVRRLGMEKSVEFFGFVDEEAKIGLYRKAIAFVNPSKKEGWGITNIEAAACGTAVVANNVAGLRDSVKHNETGLLFHENDLDDFVRCLCMVLDNKEMRGVFEENGRKWAMGFSWDESYKKMEQWIRDDVCAK